MIFSLLNVRKKTAAIIAGLAIGATCLWAISAWQNISREELLNILLATVLMLAGVILVALLFIAAFKLLVYLVQRLSGSASHSDDVSDAVVSEETREQTFTDSKDAQAD